MDDSDEPLTLTDLVVGGGPGGGGGSGIPGSQLLFVGGDRFLVWLPALDEPALLGTAPADAALRDAGGRDGVSRWAGVTDICSL